jgi:hypothetical protein
MPRQNESFSSRPLSIIDALSKPFSMLVFETEVLTVLPLECPFSERCESYFLPLGFCRCDAVFDASIVFNSRGVVVRIVSLYSA